MTFLPLGVTVDGLKDGYANQVETGGTRLLVIRLGDDIRAMSGWCTHARSLLTEQPVASDGLIECAIHGAVFDTADGGYQIGPTCDDLPRYPSRIAPDGTIEVDVPDAAPPLAPAAPFGTWGQPSTHASTPGAT